MNKYGLVSNYTVKQYKVQKSKCNEEKVENEVARQFDNRKHLEVVVSDLTYVKVQNKWNYVCILLNLANREIIGYSAGKNKNASLVYDNAVAEATFKVIKTEFASNKVFGSLE